MKACVDKEVCIGCGLCADTCPEVFELKEDKAYVKVQDVPENLKDKVKEARDNCPVDAISVEE